MVEEATVLRDLTLENPIRAIREISHDITAGARSGWPTGREPTALEIQREYFDRAPGSSSGARPTRPPSGWSTCGRRVPDGMRTRSWTASGRKVDWVTKILIVERFRAATASPSPTPRSR